MKRNKKVEKKDLNVSSRLITYTPTILSSEDIGVKFNLSEILKIIFTLSEILKIIFTLMADEIVVSGYFIDSNYRPRKNTRKKSPSKFSLFIAAALKKPEDREAVLGCIEERFKNDVKKRGYRWAKCMLWLDNLVGLWTAFGDRIVRFLKWVGLGFLIEKLLVIFR